ncbi:M48 family metallopeptidase [Planococcus dechangensis]|uniref:M48 family metallopeptidase n=1 Tax=Planococcus dechangensis TaxID=1176255 RepID=A0ABV9MHW5_9BACL
MMKKNDIQSNRETVYFVISLLFSLAIYVLAAASLIGVGIVLVFFIVVLLANIRMLGSIRGSGVQIHERQFPDVYERVQVLAKQMGLKKVPDVFVIQSEGALNAFATRFLGRDMVVLSSEVFELAREQGQDELDFLIAHELAHIKRRHIWKNLLILPARLIPFLSSAYSRSCEYTCDRHAVYTTQNATAAKRALTLLGVGKKAYLDVDEDAYLEQIHTESNGAVWLSEVLSPHPRLPKRIQSIEEFANSNAMLYEPDHGKVALSATVILGMVGVAYSALVLLMVGGTYVASQILPIGPNTQIGFESTLPFEGQTPLMVSASMGDLAAVQDAIANGADIHARDSDGENALMYATYSEETDVVLYLLEAGANPNSADDISTVLVRAMLFEDYEMAKLLLENGADPAWMGPDGMNAYSVMQADSKDELVDMLDNKLQ